MLTALWKLLVFFKYWWLSVLTPTILLVDAPLVSISKSYVALFFIAVTSFSKNLTSDLYNEVTEIQISLKLLQISQTPMLPCSGILANLHLHVAHWPRRVMMLFSKIIRLLCANRNNLSFLRETRMFKNVMLKLHALLKKHLENFWQKLWG